MKADSLARKLCTLTVCKAMCKGIASSQCWLDFGEMVLLPGKLICGPGQLHERKQSREKLSDSIHPKDIGKSITYFKMDES